MVPQPRTPTNKASRLVHWNPQRKKFGIWRVANIHVLLPCWGMHVDVLVDRGTSPSEAKLCLTYFCPSPTPPLCGRRCNVRIQIIYAFSQVLQLYIHTYKI